MAKSKMTTCKHCGAEIAASAKVCPQCGGKNKPPLSALRTIIAVIFILVGISQIFSILSGGSSSSKSTSKASASTASSVASVVPEISEDDYKAEC